MATLASFIKYLNRIWKLKLMMLENNCDTSDSRCLLDENNGTHLQVTFGATTYPNQFLEL